MNRAVFLTAYNRPEYLKRTLDSWSRVRGLSEWSFVAVIEPSPFEDQIVDIFKEFQQDSCPHLQIIVNPQRYGVLHNPWVWFEQLFQDHEFVVRAEDDLIVSEDILEFFSWASAIYQNDSDVATVCAFSGFDGDESLVLKHPSFSAWVWGTWKDRWSALIGPTWDHDYSTFTGSPGEKSGWDWNLNVRIFPLHRLVSVIPEQSRVNNIGVYGVHGTSENFVESQSFRYARPPALYRETDGM